MSDTHPSTSILPTSGDVGNDHVQPWERIFTSREPGSDFKVELNAVAEEHTPEPWELLTGWWSITNDQIQPWEHTPAWWEYDINMSPYDYDVMDEPESEPVIMTRAQRISLSIGGEADGENMQVLHPQRDK